MTPEQQHELERLRQLKQSWSSDMMNYWFRYSHMGTWQFWAILILLLVPLAVFFFTVDRKRALHIGFFGLNVHVWFLYADNLGAMNGLWEYPYKILPFMPNNLVLDASLVPVAAMLVYQWTIRRQANPFLYLALLSAVFAFLIKPFMSVNVLFELFEWMTFGYLFLFYVAILWLSLVITRLFRFTERTAHSKSQTR